MNFIPRDIEIALQKALGQFPVVLITGPRQAGKSTLLKIYLKNYTYVTLDDLNIRRLALQDPELFLATHPSPLIIDEVQYAPDLLSYIKIKVDQDRHKYGQYVLTGSQIFQLNQEISETLAGRIALFHLLPFSWSEIFKVIGKEKSKNDLVLTRQMIQGFYPEFFVNPSLDWNLWFTSYVATYLERDIRNIKAITDLTRFQTFLTLLALRVGNVLNLAELAKECGISQPTAKSWLTLFQATYIIYLLKPYHSHLGKRLIKSPKLYFLDTGLLCYLLGIESPDRLLHSNVKGKIFENMIVVELLKQSYNKGKNPSIYFYRTVNGLEIDLLQEEKGDLQPSEIKFSKNIDKKMASPLIHFLEGQPTVKGTIISLRETPLPLTKNITAIHWLQYLEDASF